MAAQRKEGNEQTISVQVMKNLFKMSLTFNNPLSC